MHRILIYGLPAARTEFFSYARVNQQSAKPVDTELLRSTCGSKEDITFRDGMNVWSINKDIRLSFCYWSWCIVMVKIRWH